MKITPEKITKLKPNEIFVFGSNINGIHGAGAARLAKLKFGAVWGCGRGWMGQTYAVPTREFTQGKGFETFDIDEIEEEIVSLEGFIMLNPDKEFLITKIGCGLAGLKIDQVAPLFESISKLPNVSLPKEFWDIINN